MDVISTRQVADLLAVSEATVKRWADAGTLRCFRTPGGHRKFRMADVAEFLRSHNYESVSHMGLAPVASMPDASVEGQPGGERAPSFIGGIGGVDTAIQQEPETVIRFRNLALAADVDGLVSLIAQQRLRGHSLAAICDGMINAALIDVGDRWQRGVLTVSQEHMAAGAVIESLARTRPLLERATAHRGKMVVACPGDEQHDIAARMAALLAHASGYTAMLVGARAPVRDLSLLITAERPRFVVLSASPASDTGVLARDLASIAEASRAVGARVIIGGWGYASLDALPEGVQRVASMDELTNVIAPG